MLCAGRVCRIHATSRSLPGCTARQRRDPRSASCLSRASRGIPKRSRNATKLSIELRICPICTGPELLSEPPGAKLSGLATDVQHFELLSRLLPRQFLDRAASTEPNEPELPPTTMLDRLAGLSNRLGFDDRLGNRPRLSPQGAQVLAVDPGELSTRLDLASKIRNAGDLELAASEYAKVLMLDPDHIPARMSRALEAIKNKRFGERGTTLKRVLNHPRLTEYLRRNPPFFRFLLQASRQFSLAGHAPEGRAVARRVLDFANAARHARGESHYNLACAYAVSARNDSQFVPLAANELWWALVAHPVYRDHYLRDPMFDPVRHGGLTKKFDANPIRLLSGNVWSPLA